MPLPSWLNEAVRAAANKISSGIRIIVSSRWFWKDYGFPLPDTRREIVRAARDMLAATNELESGSDWGTIAEHFGAEGGVGFPIGLGPDSSADAHIFVRLQFPTASGGFTLRGYAFDVPWDTPFWQIQETIQTRLSEHRDSDPPGRPTIHPGSVRIY